MQLRLYYIYPVTLFWFSFVLLSMQFLLVDELLRLHLSRQECSTISPDEVLKQVLFLPNRRVILDQFYRHLFRLVSEWLTFFLLFYWLRTLLIFTRGCFLHSFSWFTWFDGDKSRTASQFAPYYLLHPSNSLQIHDHFLQQNQSFIQKSFQKSRSENLKIFLQRFELLACSSLVEIFSIHNFFWHSQESSKYPN